ncbi:sulfatase-like hydrolase/transferase [Lentisphaera profundi]|uniref:Sulfatase-like hydrolase/transferase n=1 Tax=Lentisphaera profundi TaxID=1658616 RepID=A0ABY7VVP3_9BACT|nr:sulfatase-like hydrolase/transferase [Lentisphaera profundi]WDE97349.1 sulfatase-like hydrolase/transferase [Lentisphaera profundi]
MKITLNFFMALMAIGMLSQAAKDKPNIVLIMADDMGYECISSNGSEDYKTPAIDKLAAEGMRFEQCFANPICTPSRVKIMTGLYNKRNFTKFGVLDRSQTTFAHQLKKAGYVTAIAGKWQLGKEKDAPQHFGFDQACLWQHFRPKAKKGTTFDSRFPNPQLEINGEVVDYKNGEYGPDVCADFICDFMETNKEKPFFVYYPMILTHCPFDATPDSLTWDPKSPGSKTYKGPGDDKQKKIHFRDMVQYADKIVGKIIAKLDDLDLRENTLVIFTGDNGTDAPIKTQWQGQEVIGKKGQLVNAGTRVPFIVNWPGKIAPAVQKTELVEFSDIMPTLCEIADAPLPDNYPGDGLSLWPTLLAKGTRDKKQIYIWYYKGSFWARNISHGVLLGKSGTTYQKFPSHFETKELQFASSSERDQATFTNLKQVIDEMAKQKSLFGRPKAKIKKAKKKKS